MRKIIDGLQDASESTKGPKVQTAQIAERIPGNTVTASSVLRRLALVKERTRQGNNFVQKVRKPTG
jgi:hypothetical protein